MKRALVVSILLLSMLSCQTVTNVPNDPVTEEPQTGNVDLADYLLPDPAVGLDGLQSYTQTLSVSFTGLRNGQPFEFTDTYTQEINKQTNTQFTYMTITDVEGGQSSTIFGHAGEAYYSKSGENTCYVSWGERAQGIEPFMVTRLLPSVQSASEVGTEAFNGMQTRHYTFDAASLSYPAETRVDGDVWIAVNGGFVVKYTIHIQGGAEIFGEGTNGEQTSVYELHQINAVNGPQLPDGCPAALADFPAMPDAFDVDRLPQVLAYTSPSDASEIANFYEEQLQALGWTISSSHQFQADNNTLVFLHQDKSQIAFVTLQTVEANTWVTVKIETIESMPGMVP